MAVAILKLTPIRFDPRNAAMEIAAGAAFLPRHHEQWQQGWLGVHMMPRSNLHVT